MARETAAVKEILLWRHAKSSWGDPARPDRLRPLNGRGRRGADAVAGWLAGRPAAPDLVLCSPATRTRETLDAWLRRAADPPAVRLEPELYLASRAELLDRLRRLPEGAGRVLLIGHNEGIGELAALLATVGPADRLAALRAKYPTGALAWIAAPIDRWADLGRTRGELLIFLRPKDLIADG